MLLSIKFYWNTAMSIHLHTNCGCSCTTVQSWVIAIETTWSAQPKKNIIWPFSPQICSSSSNLLLFLYCLLKYCDHLSPGLEILWSPLLGMKLSTQPLRLGCSGLPSRVFSGPLRQNESLHSTCSSVVRPDLASFITALCSHSSDPFPICRGDDAMLYT